VTLQAMLTFAAMNLKKLALWSWKSHAFLSYFELSIKKRPFLHCEKGVFLQSDSSPVRRVFFRIYNVL
jgi:hypothetical protein